MERIVTKGDFLRAVEAIAKIQEEIRKFTPVIKEELRSLSGSDYMSKVCNNYIETKITTAKEGDFLFQCCYFHNKKYFDMINRKKKFLESKEFKKAEELERLLESEDKAGVEVNVAGLSKFITDCPHAGEFLCKLRYYTEPVPSEDHKEKVKDL
jgi:hypothetical protein